MPKMIAPVPTCANTSESMPSMGIMGDRQVSVSTSMQNEVE